MEEGGAAGWRTWTAGVMFPCPCVSVDDPKPHVCKCQSKEAESKTEISISCPVRSSKPRLEWNRDLYQTIDRHILLRGPLPEQHRAIQWQLLCESAFILLSSIYLSLGLETFGFLHAVN